MKQHSGTFACVPGTVRETASWTLPLAGVERPLWILPFWSWWQLPDYDKREETGEILENWKKRAKDLPGPIGRTLPDAPLSQPTGQPRKDHSKSGGENPTQSSGPYDDILNITSLQINLDSPDHERFPLFKDATVEHCILSPGEMLFIPAFYWHQVFRITTFFADNVNCTYQVNALDTGISINMFYGDPGEHTFLDKLFHPPFQVFIFVCDCWYDHSFCQEHFYHWFLNILEQNRGAESFSKIVSRLPEVFQMHSFILDLCRKHFSFSGNSTFCAEAVARKSHQRAGAQLHQS